MLSHTHLGTCGSGSRIVCHFLFQKSRKTKDEASNATKTQMSLRSQHGARTAIYQELHLGSANYPMTNPTFGQCICTVPLPVKTQGPRQAELSHAGRGNPGTFPRVCRKGAGGAAGWRGRSCITGKLETIRETPRNPSINHGESLGNPQRPT